MTIRVRRAIFAVAVLVATIAAGGCATPRSSTFVRDQLIGVVRNERGTPVAGALVTVSPLRRTRTDSAGRFRFDRLPAGDHTLIVSAGDHEGVRQEVHFANRTQFVQVTLVSMAELTDQAIAAVQLEYYQRAQRIAKRMQQVSPEDERTILVLRLASDDTEQER